MTVLRTHAHNGTVGGTPTAVGEGYDNLTGTPTYVAGGYSGEAIRFPAGSAFLRDDLAAEYELFWFRPVALTGDTTFLRLATSGDVSLGSVRTKATGAVALHSALATQVDITATGIVVAGTSYWLATRCGGSTQEARLYSAAGVLLDTLTGAAAAGTVGRIYIGHGHAGASTDATDIDVVSAGDAWMAPPTTITGTGVPSASPGAAAGAGAVALTGAGAATAGAASTAAAGTVSLAGTGAPAAPAGTAAGAGDLSLTGTGAAAAQAGTAAGSGASSLTGSGSATAPPGEAAGDAASTVAGTADAVAPAGAASGAGTVTVTGSGDATAPAVAAAGTGTAAGPVRDITITGRLLARPYSGSLVAPTRSGSLVRTYSGRLIRD